jgi:hypothetical protein
MLLEITFLTPFFVASIFKNHSCSQKKGNTIPVIMPECSTGTLF